MHIFLQWRNYDLIKGEAKGGAKVGGHHSHPLAYHVVVQQITY